MSTYDRRGQLIADSEPRDLELDAEHDDPLAPIQGVMLGFCIGVVVWLVLYIAWEAGRGSGHL